MIVYLSGGGVTGVWQEVNERLLQAGGSRLLSYAYKRLLVQFCELVKDKGYHCKLLVDSGAFTAWSKGEEVSLQALSDFFSDLQQRYSDNIEFRLINLDRIPGRKGVDPTKEQIEDAMEESARNFEALNKRFPNLVLPVYHQGEPITYRNDLLKTSEYICLSPRNDVAEKFRVKWCREAHTKEHKFHGLATTGINMMESVNWESVDSAGWVMVGGMGAIMYPTDNKLSLISVSSASPNRHKEDKHIDNLFCKDKMIAFIKEKGFNYEELKINDRQRYIWNAEQMINYEQNYKPKHTYEKGLFDL